MLFNSFSFVLFLAVVFVLYWLAFSRNLRLRNIFLLVASYFFYACWNWKLLFLIVFVSAVNYASGMLVARQDETCKGRKKLLLALCLAVNLGVLGYFKYCNFFIDSFVGLFNLFGASLVPPHLDIVLPVGISFYTFQGLSYTLDIYYGKSEPDRDPIAFFAFVAFFPQLVAGPIERAKDLLLQFHEAYTFDYDRTRLGLLNIAVGLFKKMVIADRLAIYVDSLYSGGEALTGLPVLLGVVLFAFQLYLDFSSYSQIAIGTASLFGFRLHRNFSHPYLASSMKEFWARWHITLTSWFRDYLYIPLGGNRRSKARVMLNVMIVFVVSGLWHGASWNFVIWGAINGAFLVISDRILHRSPRNVIGKMFGAVTVFALWTLSLIFFRSTDLSQAAEIFSSLGFGNAPAIVKAGLSSAELCFVCFCCIGLMILEYIDGNEGKRLSSWLFARKALVRWAVYMLLVLSIAYLGVYGAGNDNAFIYFQF